MTGGIHRPASLDTKGDDEVLNEEEQQYYKATIMAGCEDIQGMIKKMVEMDKMLKDEVLGFVERDIEEEDRAMRVAYAVDVQEKTNLQNPEYIKWLYSKRQQNRGGKYGGVPSEAREEEGGAEGEATAEGEEASPSMDYPVVAGGRGILHLKLSTGPAKGIVPAIVGWRGVSDSIEESLMDLLDAVFAHAAQPGVPGGSHRFVLHVNGYPLLDTRAVMAAQKEIVRALLKQDSAGVEDLYSQCLGLATRAAAVDSVVDAVDALFSSLVPSRVMKDDGSDIISFVPVELYDGQRCGLFRAVIVQGVVCGVEAMDASVNVLSACLGNPGAASSVTRAIVRQLPHQRVHQLPNTCCTLLVTPSAAADEGFSATLVGEESLGADVNLTFFTWADICGLGRGVSHLASQSISSAGVVDATVAVCDVRYTKHSVARIEVATKEEPAANKESGPLTLLPPWCLVAINEVRNAMEQESSAPAARMPSVGPDWTTLALVVGGTAVTTAVVVGAIVMRLSQRN